MMDDRETVDLTGEEFYNEDDLEKPEEPDELNLLSKETKVSAL